MNLLLILYRVFLLSICLGFVVSCAGTDMQPIAMANDDLSEMAAPETPISLAKITSRLQEGQDIGGFVWGVMCSGPYEDVLWPGKEEWRKRIPNIYESFEQGLRAAHLRPSSEKGEGSHSTVSQDFSVTADLTEVRLNLCRKTEPGTPHISLASGKSMLPSTLISWDAVLKVGLANVDNPKFQAQGLLSLRRDLPSASEAVMVWQKNDQVQGLVSAVRVVPEEKQTFIQADIQADFPDTDLALGMPLLDGQDRVLGMFVPPSQKNVQPGGDTLTLFVPIQTILSSLNMCGE